MYFQSSQNKIKEIDALYVIYHSYDETIQSIKSFYKVFDDTQLRINIIVVDNSFKEASKHKIRIFKEFCLNNSFKDFNINYISSKKNIGYGAAINKALMSTNSAIVLLVNCDTNLSKLKINSFINLLNQIDEKVVIAGPKILDKDGLRHESFFSFDPIQIFLKPLRHVNKITKNLLFLKKITFLNLYLKKLTYQNFLPQKPYLVDWISGCFMLISRKFLDDCGGFDERYFLYFEDVDICRTARKFSKLVLFDPRLEIMHEGKYESSKTKGLIKTIFSNKVARYHIYSWLHYLWKWKKDFILITKTFFYKKVLKKRFHLLSLNNKNMVNFSYLIEHKDIKKNI